MVMNFVLHHLSHYNSITKSRARFLLSLIEDLTIDFPSYFILYLIDVYRDTTTHDKLVFPSIIMRIIRHHSTPYPKSSHFTVIGAISAVSVQQSEAQLRSKQPQIETATPLVPSAPSTSAPHSSLVGGVTLQVVMAQLERMDARLDIFTTELYQVNTRFSRIARRQACMGGFAASPSPSPSPIATKDEDTDDGSSEDDDDKDEDASSSGDEEMTTSQ